jgi:hypothetical protein
MTFIGARDPVRRGSSDQNLRRFTTIIHNMVNLGILPFHGGVLWNCCGSPWAPLVMSR